MGCYGLEMGSIICVSAYSQFPQAAMRALRLIKWEECIAAPKV